MLGLGNPDLECLIQTFKFPGQFGTHIDFPGHFAKGKDLSEKYDVNDLIFPLVVVDISQKAAANGHETLDTDASIVAIEHQDLACERYVLEQEKLQVELLKSLDEVAPAGAVIIVSYPRIEEATGLPARIWAITE